MSKAHYNEETGLFHEDHFRNELAKVSFTQSVMEKYLTYEEREKLVNALRDEIKDIPTIWIPYGTFIHDGRMFVYSSGWDEEEEFYFMLIDQVLWLTWLALSQKTSSKTIQTKIRQTKFFTKCLGAVNAAPSTKE